MRWVIHGGEATLRGPEGDREVVFAFVRPEKSGYRVYLRGPEGQEHKRIKLPNRSVSMEKMMALALAHIKMR